MTAGQEGTRLAEEVRLLVDMVAERAAPWLDNLIASGHDGQHHELGAEQDHGDDRCPLCMVVAIVTGEQPPEITARLVEQATQLIALLRAVLADRWYPQEGFHMPGFQPSSRMASDVGDPGTRVQHIPVHPRQRWQG